MLFMSLNLYGKILEVLLQNLMLIEHFETYIENNKNISTSIQLKSCGKRLYINPNCVNL